MRETDEEAQMGRREWKDSMTATRNVGETDGRMTKTKAMREIIKK